jgi:hypothetical protein
MHPIAMRHFQHIERAKRQTGRAQTARRLPGGEKFFALLSITASVVAIALICLGANRSAADGPGHPLLSMGASDGIPSAPRQADMGSFSGY